MSAALQRTFVLRNEQHAQSLWGFLRSNWRALADQGKPLAVTIAEHKAKRSAQANRYYWNRLNEIAEQVWLEGRRFDADCWHEAAKRRFLGITDLPGGGQAGISTTTLSTAEFAEYVQKVEAWASTELGVEFQ